MPRDAEDPAPPDEASLDEWRAHLEDVGAREGFFRSIGDRHSALYIERGDTLIVTFENLDHVYERGIDRMPWGYGFVAANGWSMRRHVCRMP